MDTKYLFLVIIIVAICRLAFVSANNDKLKKRYGDGELLLVDKFQFIGGLDLPQNVMCKLTCLRSRIIMQANGQEFNLQTDKLIDVSIMTNTEIQKQYVSSAGGAVAGAMLLGPIGAILGGSASKRSIKTNTKYLIFTYLADVQTKYILFDVTKKTPQAKRLVKQFSYLKNKDTVKIDL